MCVRVATISIYVNLGMAICKQRNFCCYSYISAPPLDLSSRELSSTSTAVTEVKHPGERADIASEYIWYVNMQNG